jgi:hypothetical protein
MEAFDTHTIDKFDCPMMPLEESYNSILDLEVLEASLGAAL